VVRSERYIPGMEIIRAKFSPLDTWKKSVAAPRRPRYTFADTDGFPLS
jgi:hypothetical protein